MAEWINTLLQGLLLGGLYALFATGLSLAFGIMRFLNIAHGDFIVLAAYLGLMATQGLGLGPFTALVVVVPAMALLGYGLQRGIFNRTLKLAGKDILPPLLVTFGLSIILQNGMMQAFSANAQGLDAGSLETASLNVGGDVAVGLFPVLLLATAVAVIVGLQALFARTSLGRAFRAASDEPEIAQLMGIDTRHVYALAMGLAMAVVAIAGIYLGIRTTFAPADGPERLLYAFEAVIIGGLGSLWGTLAGGMVLGLSQTVGFKLDPGWGILAGHLTFLAVLVFRPLGLFPRTRDR